MAIIRKSNLFSSSSLFSRLQSLVFELKRLEHTSSAETEVCPVSLLEGPFDTSTWKTVDSRTLGVGRHDLTPATWMVLKVLQRKGFEAYLVGGCVRDLILKKTPKDFDVVTDASLRQIKRHFHRCRVVGRRFPICHVNLLGSTVEVSSFKTAQVDAQDKKTIIFPQMPDCCDKKDFARWKDSMRRDFTVNGLFYDPFLYRIYDYVNGIKDIKASKVRTVIPAHLSFKEDCARILRGLRIVARLGLRFSKDTAAAVRVFSSSLSTLDKGRLALELNYMLAYGAAVPSIYLLQKYKLLEFFLPVHAAYLADQTKNEASGSSIMLMKLFSSVDKLLSADRPSSCTLWLGLLAFHLTLLNHPQDALVVRTFTSILYFGTWHKAIKFVRENATSQAQFAPEILEPSRAKSDELLLEETSRFVSKIKTSVDALSNVDALQQGLARHRMTSPCSGLDMQDVLVFVSEKTRKSLVRLFDVLETGTESEAGERETYEIDYELLKNGDPDETRLVLGKIIMDTMNSDPIQQQNESETVVTESSEAFRQQNEIMDKLIGEQIHQQNKSDVADTKNGEVIRQQSENGVVDIKIGEVLHRESESESEVVDIKNDEVLHQESESDVVDIKNDEVIHEKNMDVVVDTNNGEVICQQIEDVDTQHGEVIHQQNQNSSAVRKVHLPLSALFR